MGTLFIHGLLVGASALVITMYAVFVSGMFPRAARPEAMRGRAGAPLMAAGALLASLLAVRAIVGAVTYLAWPYVVIAVGLGVLAGPLAFQALPQALSDTPRGAVGLCVATILLLGAWALVSA